MTRLFVTSWYEVKPNPPLPPRVSWCAVRQFLCQFLINSDLSDLPAPAAAVVGRRRRRVGSMQIAEIAMRE
jgi:hypothetical protein